MNKFNAESSVKQNRQVWSTPQVIDLDDRRGVEGGATPAPESASPALFSMS
jgi:hypothetical protein